MRAYQAAPGSPRASAGRIDRREGGRSAEGEPGQLEGEEVEEEKTQHELGHDDTEQRTTQDRAVQGSLPVQGGHDPKRHTDDYGDDHSGRGERRRRRQPAYDQAADGLTGGVGAAQVPVKKPADVEAVLDPKGPIEAELSANYLVLGMGGAYSRVQLCRVHRGEEGHPECHDRDRKEHEEHPSDPSEHVADHDGTPQGRVQL